MYHKSNYGAFGGDIPCDIDGYVPERDDPFAGNWDHGGEQTHDDDGALTEYGEWWTGTRFPELVDAAEKAAAEAEKDLAEWRENA